MGLWSRIKERIKARRIQPEDKYQVEITDYYIRVTHPDIPTEQIEWSEIEDIKLINTDEGPFLPDIWLVLSGNHKQVTIPQGCAGWDNVYEIVSQYEGFNFRNVIESARYAGNKTYPLWKR